MRKNIQLLINAINTIEPNEITGEILQSLSSFKKHGFPSELVALADRKIQQHYIEAVKKQVKVLPSSIKVSYSTNEQVPLCYSH